MYSAVCCYGWSVRSLLVLSFNCGCPEICDFALLLQGWQNPTHQMYWINFTPPTFCDIKQKLTSWTFCYPSFLCWLQCFVSQQQIQLSSSTVSNFCCCENLWRFYVISVFWPSLLVYILVHLVCYRFLFLMYVTMLSSRMRVPCSTHPLLFSSTPYLHTPLQDVILIDCPSYIAINFFQLSVSSWPNFGIPWLFLVTRHLGNICYIR